MIQFIQSVLSFIDTIYGGVNDILAFVPKAFAYLNYFVSALPNFLAPTVAIAVSILIFNRVTKLL